MLPRWRTTIQRLRMTKNEKMAMGISRDQVALCMLVSISAIVVSIRTTSRCATTSACPSLVWIEVLSLTRPGLTREILILLLHVFIALPTLTAVLQRAKSGKTEDCTRICVHISCAFPL